MGYEASTVKRVILLAGVAVAIAIAIGITLALVDESGAPYWTKPAPYNATRAQHGEGGEARVAVSTPAELPDTGPGGVALRSLVLPHLFDARPNGTWTPSLVQPGSDGAATNGLTAWFTLRKQTWSDGRPITVEDLRRTMDTRFVSSIAGPDANGRITVHLKSKLPSWRMLWSGDGGITAPQANVSAGPFIVKSVTSGEETVLSRSSNWFAPAFLDTVKLDYVPDSTMARQLFGAGQVDVVAPVADTQRTNLYRAIPGSSVSTSNLGGRWTALKFNTTSPNSTYAGVLSAFPRKVFVNALLPGEASIVNGFAVNDSTWTNYSPAPGLNVASANVTLTVPAEEPLSNLLATSLERAVTAAGGKLQVRSTDTATLNSYVGAKTYDLAFVTYQSQPQFCWTCVFGDIDPALAQRADAGDNEAAIALEEKARDGGMLLPLWRDLPFVTYKPQIVRGIQANGFSGSATWNAADWWKP